MNFKLTRSKGVISIIIPIIIWASLFVINTSWIENLPAIIVNFLSMHNISNLFTIGNIFLFLIEVLAIYLILSVFQKKKKVPSQQDQLSPSQPLVSPKAQIPSQ